MFLKERQAEIARLVEAEGRVTVSGLARRFGVTEDCIRKDLRQLEGEGLLKKVYGGAVGVASALERNVIKRVGAHEAEKRAVAQAAYDLIEPGETIFLDVATTNLSLAELLAAGSKQVCVVSNMMEILRVLSRNPALEVLGTGGSVNPELDGFMGSMTLACLRPLRFDHAFLGGLGVDAETGEVTTYLWDDAMVKQLALANAAHSLLMVDEHKFGASGSYVYATIGDFDGIVTNRELPGLAERIAELGSTLITG